MNAADVAFLTLDAARLLLDEGAVSSVELTTAQLERIAALDERLNAYITVLRDAALAQAAVADKRRRAGERGTLLGLPLAVKDLYETAGVRTTAGSRALADTVPTRDATVVRRLQAAGAVQLGKTNMMEFAYGYPHPDFGETRNPWDLSRTAGGSSGGSAAAVAAGLAYAALGSDTGGSIRSPAAYCGIVGLKPTYGRVSRAGVVPLSWSLDHAGPLTRTASDCAIVFDAIAGYDPLDPASASPPYAPTVDTLDAPVAGLRVGVVEELFARYVAPELRALAEAALRELEQLGVLLERIELPHAREVGPVIMPIIQAEATSFHWPLLTTNPADYSAALRENLLRGATVLAKDYLDAQRARRLMQDEVNAALTCVDALVFPTQPIVAPLLDAYAVGDGVEEDVLDVEIGHTGLANLTGHPALSIPCGFTAAGLPVGLQLTGRWFDEATLLRLAQAYEAATGWRTRRPTAVS
jgi:aspartyl-tRNA(Asn)/glutamyl-tRNA(Gln) amidotransferase subunit A